MKTRSGRGVAAVSAGIVLLLLSALPAPALGQNSWCPASLQYSGSLPTGSDAGALTVDVDSEQKVPSQNRVSWAETYIDVETVRSGQGTELGCVTVVSPCDHEQGPQHGGVPLVAPCAGTRVGDPVQLTVVHNGQSGEFQALAGHKYELTLKDRRDPVTLEGRLVWEDTGDPVSGTLTLDDGDGNRERIALGSDGRFSHVLPLGFRRGENVGVDVDQNDIPNFDLPECPPSRDCWTIPGDGDVGTKEHALPRVRFHVKVGWRSGGDGPPGTVSARLDGSTIGEVEVRDAASVYVLETGTAIERPRQVAVEFSPDFVPGLTYREEIQYEPQDWVRNFGPSPDVELDLTPPEIRVSGGVVDMHEDGKPVKADLTVEDDGQNTVATTTSSQRDGSFDMTVDPWKAPVSGIAVDPDPNLYPSLQARQYGRSFWTTNVDASTGAYDDTQPTVVSPGQKASFHLDHLALEVSGEMKPVALEGRLRWEEQRLRDQVGNRTLGRTHAFHDEYPRGTIDMLEFDATGVKIGPHGSAGSTRQSVGSTTIGDADDGEFRIEFGDFYTSRTVFFEFTPASASNVTYTSRAIRVERGERVEEEIPHPALDVHGTIRDPDGCAIAATIEFHPALPAGASWSQDVASSGRLDERGRNFSGTIEHVPMRKVVIRPSVDYLREKTLSQEEWRDLLDGALTAYDPSESHEHDLEGRDRPRFLARELDVELEYVRPSPLEHADVDRDGVPRKVERHLARVHRPSYWFDERESAMPGDLDSYLEHSRLENTLDRGDLDGGLADELPGPNVLDDLQGVPYLHNEKETPSPLDWGPAYVRVEKLDAGRLEEAAYRVSYGLWYDRGRDGPFYLSAERGREYRGAFRELFVDVQRGEVERVFLRNYDHDGTGERAVAGVPFDFAASSYTYRTGGTGRSSYDPLVESDELDRLRWEGFGHHDGARRPQYFRVYVAADTHNQFLRPGKTFLRPMGISTDRETVDAVKRAVFGTSSFVPQIHRGNKSTRFNRNVNVVFRPDVVLLTPSGELSELVGDGRRPVGKPSGGDISDSFVQFPGYWGQDHATVEASDGDERVVWLSTDGPAPMDYDTADRLGSGLAPPSGQRVPRGELERIQRVVDTGGPLFGPGYGGAGAAADATGGDEEEDEGDGPAGGGSAAGDHLYAWSGDATFQYVAGACLDGGVCSSTPGASGGAAYLPGRGTGVAPTVVPDLGGEVSGFAQKYPASGDAYLDADFRGHAFGTESRFLRVTGMRQTGQGGSATATTLRYDGVLRSFASMPPGTAYVFQLLSGGATFSFLGFEVGTEVNVEVELNRPTAQARGGAGQRARVLDAGLSGDWAIVHVGWDASGLGMPVAAPAFSFTPLEAERENLFGTTLNVDVGAESLRSWLELSANYGLSIGVRSQFQMGRLGLESSFTNFELFDYRVAETRFDLLP